MAGQKVETTHKHRNIIDDILDLGLLVLMVVWYFTGIELDEETLAIDDVNSPELEQLIGSRLAQDLRDHLELVEGVYPPFDREAYLAGSQQPVFFGSALNNFGVRELLDCFIEIAPTPRAKKAEERLVAADEPQMTGFVFKIHANMDPKHRDRLAFVKIVSGTFEL